MIYQGKKGAEQVLANLRRRAEGDLSEVETRVKEILADVQARGDQALAEYALKFDDTDYQKTPLIVGEEEIQQAYAQVDEKRWQRLGFAPPMCANTMKSSWKRDIVFRSLAFA